MTLEGALRASTLNAIHALKETVELLGEIEIEEVALYLKRGPSIRARFDYNAAIEVLSQFGLRAQDLPPEPADCSRAIIYLIIRHYRPYWLKYARSGLAAFRDAIPVNVRQCFRDLGLFQMPLSERNLQWWDTVRAMAYAELDRTRIENGRRAELLCVQREKQILAVNGRTDLVPEIVSIESDKDGYDVLSYAVAGGAVVERPIEVKGFTGDIPYFHLSPNQWLAAQENAPAYRLQVWSLDREALIYELTCEELEAHIADNRGCGEWDDLLITLPTRRNAIRETPSNPTTT